MLSQQEEFSLAQDWIKNKNVQSAHKLVTSHLRLVAKVAVGYRGYGLPMNDLVAEGNIGLMKSVKKFDPNKGFRLSTYALWWIKASMQEYILRNWSLVKIGTTSAQKKLFFNLRKIKNKLSRIEYQPADQTAGEKSMPTDTAQAIATEMNVSKQDVLEMDARLNGDMSLNTPINTDEGTGEWQDWIADESETQEQTLIQDEITAKRQQLLTDALHTLNERERDIITQRRLSDTTATLEHLSDHYKISRERIRQIETRAMEKLHAHIRDNVVV